MTERVHYIDTSIEIRRNVDAFEQAMAQYLIWGDAPGLLEDYTNAVAYTAVAYAEQSNHVAAELFGVPKSHVRACVNQMRTPTKSGKPKLTGVCQRGHDLEDPDNVWTSKRADGTPRRTCKKCYEEMRDAAAKQPRVYPLKDFCLRGHDMSIHRRRNKRGDSFCSECRRVRSRGYTAAKSKEIQ